MVEKTQDFKFWTKKLNLFKFLTMFDYAFGMTGWVYRNLWFSANGIDVGQLFLLNVLGVLFSLIFQNIFSYISDKTHFRFPFYIGANVLQGLAMVITALFPNFYIFIIHIFLWNIISSESSRIVMVYEIIEYAKDPNFNESKYNRSKEFAKYRIFGSIGFAVMAPIVGYSIHFLNISRNLDPMNGFYGYQVMFILSGIGYLLYSLLITHVLKPYYDIEKSRFKRLRKQKEDTLPNIKSPVSIKSQDSAPKTLFGRIMETKLRFNVDGLKRVFRSKEFIAILIPQAFFMLVNSLGSGVIDIYFKDLGADLRFIGWRPFIWAIIELPLFFLSAKLYKKFGHNKVILISFLFYMMKMIVYYFFMDETLIYLEFILLLFNPFGLTWPAITDALKEHLPAQNSFAMTLLNSTKQVFSLFGGLIGIYISSLYVDQNQVYSDIFLYAMIFCTISIALNIILTNWVDKSKNILKID